MGLVGKDTDKKEEKSVIERLGGIEVEDLVKFGMIPEFIGRLPVTALLEELNEEALIRILSEPKNAITKQYRKLFEYENIELEFEPDSLSEVAKIALKRKTGARGLRAILEQTMLEVMYEIPSNKNINKVIVTRDSILGKESPRMISGPRVKNSETESETEGLKKASIESAS